MYGTCKVCGCTDDNACVVPGEENCHWANDDHDICSRCIDKFIKVGGVLAQFIYGESTPASREVKTIKMTRNQALDLIVEWEHEGFEDAIRNFEKKDKFPHDLELKRLIAIFKVARVELKNYINRCANQPK